MGGGSAGKTDWPDYMKTAHGDMLIGGGGVNGVLNDMVNAAAVNPWLNFTAFNPDSIITLMVGVVTDLLTWMGDFGSDADIAASVTAYDVILTDSLEATTVPHYEAGMRNINAVQSSAFAIGKALLYSKKDHEVANFATVNKIDYRIKAAQVRIAAVQLYNETSRLRVTMKKEEYDQLIESVVHNATWRLDLYQYCNAAMGSISGASMGMSPTMPNKMQTALAGAIGGAAVGAYFGGWGAVIGGAAGGIGGYLSGS